MSRPNHQGFFLNEDPDPEEKIENAVNQRPYYSCRPQIIFSAFQGKFVPSPGPGNFPVETDPSYLKDCVGFIRIRIQNIYRYVKDGMRFQKK
jgi:hypothetical protein